MIARRTARRADLVHYLAATLLMVIAVDSTHDWLWTPVAILAYFVVCGGQSIVYGGLRLYAAEADDR